MIHSLQNLSKRDKAVYVGLFLSKFDKKALESFGFTGFWQAFNVIGLSIGVSPASIKNYRDEFDPYFPNPRKGWHNRQLRDFCRTIMEDACEFSFDVFKGLIYSFINDDIIPLDDYENTDEQYYNKNVANRLLTGKAAEEYFVQYYNSINLFSGYEITDTTKWGCGFDFKLANGSNRFYIEVKGINDKSSNILMTAKEFDVAKALKEKYCLFVVRNFVEKPEHKFFLNPVSSPDITLKRQEQIITQVNYNTSLIW